MYSVSKFNIALFWYLVSVIDNKTYLVQYRQISLNGLASHLLVNPNFEIPCCHKQIMTIAYVLINCELGAEETLVEKLREIEQVKEVFGTIGTHDMMVKLDAENFEKIRSISQNIQKIEKVRNISTLIRKDN